MSLRRNLTRATGFTHFALSRERSRSVKSPNYYRISFAFHLLHKKITVHLLSRDGTCEQPSGESRLPFASMIRWRLNDFVASDSFRVFQNPSSAIFNFYEQRSQRPRSVRSALNYLPTVPCPVRPIWGVVDRGGP